MRVLLLCLLMVLSVGCSGDGAGPAQPALIDQTVVEALATDAAATVSIIGYLVQDDRGVVLTGGMSFAANPPAPLTDAPELWLGPTPPEEPALTHVGERSFALVRVVGVLEGPGSFGPSGIAYQVREPRITAVEPRPTELTALLAAAATSENQVLQISGQLLSGPGTNLLVEELGPGGVPDAAARQIKLITPAGDPALNERLAPGGGVRYGPVKVIGIWRAGSIYALAIVPTDG